MERYDILNELFKFRDEWYPAPMKYPMKHGEFETMSYKHFAMNELILFVVDHKDIPVMNAVEMFAKAMDEYACQACGNDGGIIFSISYDVAMNVLDELICRDC